MDFLFGFIGGGIIGFVCGFLGRRWIDDDDKPRGFPYLFFNLLDIGCWSIIVGVVFPFVVFFTNMKNAPIADVDLGRFVGLYGVSIYMLLLGRKRVN